MKAKLTDRFLTAIAAKGEAHPPVWDTMVSGFGIRVSKHGAISFFACRRLRNGGGKPIRIACGSYPLVTLADGRERARKALRDLAAGIDPRHKAKAESAKQKNLYGEVAEEFIRRHLPGKRTAREIELRIRRELISRWGKRPIASIKRADVVAMIDELVDRGHRGTAHQTFTYGKVLHDWAIERGVYGIEHSPFDRLKRAKLIGKQQPRQRRLSGGELRSIWRAASDSPSPEGEYVKLLLLLGTRRGKELPLARWPEFDIGAGTFVIPPERMKGNAAHLVLLAPAAVAILEGLPRIAGTDFVFTRGNRPIGDFSRIKARLDERIKTINGRVPIPRWTFHDLRRAFRTGLSTLGIERHIAEMCIAHKQDGIVAVYDLHRFEAEKRQAFECWASALLATVGDNVVPLRQAS
jgi:integrase